MPKVTNNLFNINSHTVALIAVTSLAFFIPLSTALTNICALLASIAMLCNHAARTRFKELVYNPGAYGFILLFLIVLLWTLVSENGFTEAERILGKYAKWLCIPIIAAIFSKSEDMAWPILGFLTSMLLSLLVSYGFWLGIFTPFADFFSTIDFTQRQQNPYAFKLHITHNMFMVIAASMALYIAWIKYTSSYLMHFLNHSWIIKSPTWAWLLFGIAGLYNSVFMVAGRISLIMLLTLGLYTFYSLLRTRKINLKLSAIVILVLTLIIISLNIMDTSMGARLAEGLYEIQQWHPGNLEQTSMGIRLGLWHEALHMIQQAPLLGQGTGSYQRLFELTPLAAVLPPTGNPHQQFLLLWVEQGIIGVGGYIAVLAIVYWHNSPQNNPASTWLRALLLVYTTGNFFNSLHYDFSESWLFVVAMGCLAFPIRTR